jgi:hypothetical protein
MEADEPSQLALLPRRNSQFKSKFKNAQEVVFFTNLYEIDTNQQNSTMYQFVLETTPEIPQDSAGLYRSIYRKIHKELREKLQDVIESGQMVWGFKNLNKPAVFQAAFNENDHEYKFDILLKPTKSV